MFANSYSCSHNYVLPNSDTTLPSRTNVFKNCANLC